jgi:CRP-like cAMP-binding protein
MAASSQTPTPPLASDLPSAKASDSSTDQALTLLLADETEAALRWGAAALQRDPSTASALVVTSRLLQRMGRTRAAVEGLRVAVRRAIGAGNLPLAIASIDELRILGEDVGDLFDRVSETFCDGSPRLDEASAPLSPHFDDFQPLSSFLAGPALASKAAQIVQEATRADDPTFEALPRVARLPLFSALPKDALRDLLAAFDVITVPAGHCVMEEGETGDTAYIVARGELLLRRASGTKPPVVLARLGTGAFFGEMALLSNMPRSASAVATRPSILLVATREALDAIARKHPIVAVELAAHCHRRLVANLGRMAPILAALPPAERAVIVGKFVTRIFAKGERLTTKGQEIGGLHLLASGAVAVVAHDGSERVVLATLSAGETIGEVELVLCRKANVDAIALQPTVALFLSREDFSDLVLDHPALVHGLYVSAVRRAGETADALESSSFATNDYQLDEILVDETFHNNSVGAEEPQPTGDAYQEAAPPVVANIQDAEAETLPSRPSAAVESRGTAPITAPFPPVLRSASPMSVPPALPSQAAAPEPPVSIGASFASAPTVPLSPRPIGEPQKPAPLPRFSSMSALVASAPPRSTSAPSAPRPRRFWQLPPAAVLGIFAAVALLGFALAAPFSNHVNTAAASGGGAQNAVEPSGIPGADPAPASEPSPVAVAPVAPLPAPPAKTELPAPEVAPTAGARPHAAKSPPTTEPDTEGRAPAPSTTVAASAPQPRRKAATTTTPDEFGGRE